jgi:hypothetical protein
VMHIGVRIHPDEHDTINHLLASFRSTSHGPRAIRTRQ